MRVAAAVREIHANYDDKYWWRERIQNRIVSPLFASLYGTNGVDVVDRDWDNLLVLDACRADMFESVVDTDQFDTYERVRSRGSSSPDWISANFAEKKLGDIVYVTANPWVAKVAPSSFHEVVDAWSMEQGDAVDFESRDLTDLNLSTSPSASVPADQLNDVVREVAEEFPDKRYIVHYFQPHAPCIGKPDGSLKSRSEMDLQLHPGEPLFDGAVSRKKVWEAYEDNLAYVQKHAEELAEEVGGKTVFTADHGELFGEWLWPIPIRGYAHPQSLHHPKLVTVPWAERTVGNRRRIRAGGTTEADSTEADIERQLEKLGYL